MTENAVLERLLSEADPAPTPRDAAPDARALEIRDRILRTGGIPKRHCARALGSAGGRWQILSVRLQQVVYGCTGRRRRRRGTHLGP